MSQAGGISNEIKKRGQWWKVFFFLAGFAIKVNFCVCRGKKWGVGHTSFLSFCRVNCGFVHPNWSN